MPSVQDPVNAKFIDSFISLCNWLSDVCSQVKYFCNTTGDDDNVTNLSIIQELTQSSNYTLDTTVQQKITTTFFFPFNYTGTKLLLVSYI